MSNRLKKEVPKLSLPSDLSYLPIARLFVQETAKKFGFEGNDLYKIALALEEAVTNVMEHAFEDDESGSFDILCERVPLGMKIVIKEKGIPFDPSRLPQYTPAADLENLTTSGMGLFLMRESMDEVSFHNLGMEGKETTLVKYLPTKNIEEYFSKGEIERERTKPPEPIIKEKIEYEVRRMEPAEAIEISRCAYKSHGYTFFDDHIYYPDRLVELNRSDQMISAVAVTREKTFMGHSALVYPYPGAHIAELTFIFVNREYRGQGCMEKMNDFLFTCPKQYPLDGIYVYSVTNHEFTQRGVSRIGFRDCGLLLASSPETWVFKGIAGENPQRISVALSFNYLKKTDPLTLYAPPQHLEMIRKLYRNIGSAEHLFSTQNTDAERPPKLPEEDAEIETDVIMTENCAEIHLFRYGANIFREVKKTVRDLCLKHVAAVQLFLPLEDPLTASVTAGFEDMGFFFAGILPMAAIGDTLILQYLNNVVIDYEKISLYTEAAREIRDYVRARDPNFALGE